MKVAIPTVDNQLARHFGHCQQFTIFEVDTKTGSVKDCQATEPPPHGTAVESFELGVVSVRCPGISRLVARDPELLLSNNSPVKKVDNPETIILWSDPP